MAILEARLVISGQDQTGPAFKEIEKKMASIGKSFAGAAGVSSTVSKLSSTINSATLGVDKMAAAFGTVSLAVTKIEGQIGLLGRSIRGLKGIAAGVGGSLGGLGGMVGLGAGFKAVSSVEKAVAASADYAGELAHLKYAVHATPSELAAAEKAAVDLPKKYSNISAAGVLQTFGEMIATVQNRSEVPGLLESAIATKSALETEGKHIDPEDNRRLLKAAEIANRTRSPEEFDKYGEGMVRARQMEGNLVTSSDVLQFSQNAGSAVRAMSDRFLLTIGPSLMGEQSGAKSGAAMQQIYKLMTGTSLTHAPDAVQELLSLGFLQQSDVLRNKHGEAKGLMPGHTVKDAALGMSDFDIWMKQDFIPAMDAKGYNETQKRAAISRIFKGKIGPSEAEMIMTQMPLLEQHAANYAATGGRAGAALSREHSPLKAMEDVSTAFGNAMTALTGPAMQAFAPAAEHFANAVNAIVPILKDFAKEHPIAATAGVAGAAGVAALTAWEMLKAGGRAIFGGGAAAGGEAAKRGMIGTIAGAATSAPILLGGAGLLASTSAANAGEDERARQRRFSLPTFAQPGISGLGGQVMAKLDGQASVTVDLRLDASPELSRLIQFDATTRTNASGDLGTSMPESSPNGRFGFSR